MPLSPQEATVLSATIAALVGAMGIGLPLYVAHRRVKVEDQKQRDRITVALASDIASIIRMLSQSGLIEHFVRLHDEPNADNPFANAPGNENYFALYHSLAAEIGRLDTTYRVRRAVEFYQFLKASRDAAVPLRNKHGPGMETTVRLVTRNVLVLLHAVLVAAEEFFRPKDSNEGASAQIAAIYASEVARLISDGKAKTKRFLDKSNAITNVAEASASVG